jgi:hypothetical protein
VWRSTSGDGSRFGVRVAVRVSAGKSLIECGLIVIQEGRAKKSALGTKVSLQG